MASFREPRGRRAPTGTPGERSNRGKRRGSERRRGQIFQWHSWSNLFVFVGQRGDSSLEGPEVKQLLDEWEGVDPPGQAFGPFNSLTPFWHFSGHFSGTFLPLSGMEASF